MKPSPQWLFQPFLTPSPATTSPLQSGTLQTALWEGRDLGAWPTMVSQGPRALTTAKSQSWQVITTGLQQGTGPGILPALPSRGLGALCLLLPPPPDHPRVLGLNLDTLHDDCMMDLCLSP